MPASRRTGAFATAPAIRAAFPRIKPALEIRARTPASVASSTSMPLPVCRGAMPRRLTEENHQNETKYQFIRALDRVNIGNKQ